MASFTYEALTQEGTITRGAADASGEPELELQLPGNGLYLIRASSATGAADEALTGDRRKLTDGKVRHVDLLAFTVYLYGSSQAGIPLITTLADLEVQLESRLLRTVTAEIRTSMATDGSSLSEALAEHPRIFNRLYLATVQAGEATGQLDYALSQLVDYQEWQRKITLQVRHALAVLQPLMVVVVGGVLALVALSIFLPLVGIYQSLGR